MCTADSNGPWSLVDLRVNTLMVLYAARQRRNDAKAGASGKMLKDCLAAEDHQLVLALHWLKDHDYIEAGERVFTITTKGIEYLTEQLGPGNMPPNDHSPVPRRPYPADRDGGVALPLPPPEI